MSAVIKVTSLLFVAVGISLFPGSQAKAGSFYPEQVEIKDVELIQWAKGQSSEILIGDMVFRRDQIVSRGGFAGSRWPDGKVYFYFAANVEASVRDTFLAQTLAWSRIANVKFIESETAANVIRVSQDQTMGENSCNSYLGMIGGLQPLRLPAGCHGAITIAHEIGHALGFAHEHNRSDRNAYVTIVFNNIANDWLNQYSIDSTVNYLPYDYYSIMHYRSTGSSDQCASGISGCQTITSVPLGSICRRDQMDPEFRFSPQTCTDAMGNRRFISYSDLRSLAYRYGTNLNINFAPETIGAGTTLIVNGKSCSTSCSVTVPYETDFTISMSQGDVAIRVGKCILSAGASCTTSFAGPTTIPALPIGKLPALISMAHGFASGQNVFNDGFE